MNFFPFLVSIVALSWMPGAVGAVTVDAVEARYDLSSELVTFNIDFSGPPDFATVDAVGRQRTGFAIYIDNQAGLTPANYDHIDVVLWGEDLSDGVVAIDKDFANGNIDYGGWGVTIGFFDYMLTGDLMTWTMPLSAIGETGDGRFSYNLLLTEFGGMTDSVNAKSRAVGAIPAPTSVISALSGLALLLGVGWRPIHRRPIHTAT